jgi:hypothetical protein
MFDNWLWRRFPRPAVKRPGVRPRLEVLEDRAVPAIFNIAAGDVPGLIAALDAANTNGQPDTVNLAPGATYTLTAPGPSPPSVAAGLTVLADGGQLLTVNGNGATIARAASSPDFRILAVSDGAVVTLSGLTLTNGNNPIGPGGGIDNRGTLTLSNSTLSGNSAIGGGGIYNLGTLTVSNCTLSGNSASFGGGLFNDKVGPAALTNCTLSGNSAARDGGGIFNLRLLTVTNATITANRADADFDNSGQGGGINSAATLRLRNTIVAGNFHGAASGRDDIFGAAEASAFNLVGDGTGLTGISNNDANGNLVGTALAPLDPRLGPLQDNGGPTRTHALLAGSPAIDRGLAPGVAPDTDQRGVSRQGPPDIGAFEFLPPPPVPPVPPARAVVAALVSRKVGKRRLLFVRVSFADTGALKAEVRSPFQQPAFRAIAVAAIDGDGDGVADSVRLTARRGRKTMRRLLAL